MSQLPDNCIDLTITSPPYDNLRKYNGYSFNFERTAEEIYRLTKKGGVLVWIINDATIKGSETGTSFKQALYLKKIGFNLHDTMIWKKKNYIPLTHNRYEQSFEYMFIFSKGKPSVFNPIKINCKCDGSKVNRKKSNKEDGSGIRNRAEITTVKKQKIKPNVWEFAVARTKYNHPAVFPTNLVIDHIKTWTNKKDIVFDPFLGSGTTAIAAIKTDRHYIGFDISKEYIEIAKKRIKEVQHD